jgi:hypothetical protein
MRKYCPCSISQNIPLQCLTMKLPLVVTQDATNKMATKTIKRNLGNEICINVPMTSDIFMAM